MATTAVENRIPFVENDTADALDIEYEGVDITGFTVTFHIQYPSGCPLVKTATMTDPVNGKCRVTFDYGDLRAGSYAGELRITDTLGKELTISSLTLDIAKRIKR